jgi:type III pantothenate kinase
MYQLIVDVGNTNIKFGFFQNDKLIHVYIMPTEKYSYRNLQQLLKNKLCQAIYVGSVVHELTTRLLHDLKSITTINAKLIKPSDFKLIFDLSKFNANEIGTDILALALITKHLQKKAIAICFGTATFAVLVNNNQLIGVSIAPSIELGIKQLSTTTSLIKKVNTEIGDLDLGTNTPTSLQSGGSHMARGFIISILDYVNKHYHINKALITGGKTTYLKFIKHIPYTTVLNHAILLGYYHLTKLFRHK